MGYRILRYHNVTEKDEPQGVSPAMLEKHIKYLIESNMQLVPLRKLADRIRRGIDTTGNVAITFDDGYRNHLRIAAKILKQYDVPATFFVTLRQGYIQGEERAFLDRNEIRQLSDMGFEIGNHTYSHRILPQALKREAYQEITYGKQELERITKKEVVSFCFPGEAYNERLLRMIKGTGHSCAIVSQRFLKPRDEFHLLRFSANDMRGLRISLSSSAELKKAKRRRFLVDMGRLLIKDRWCSYL